MRTDNPVIDEINHTTKVEERIKKLPICIDCGEHIQDDGAFCIDGDWYCKKCMERFWRWLE